ncbi:bacteriohemerythrin [Undibacterium arcticum]|uniref:Bacteriohemerythrin n=2 Tax=Undibacterium arcticum TaxID=1762892 RepID=A0ABV7EZE9_9BURK
MMNQDFANAAFEWTDNFKLGHAAMDDTHQEFVEIVNRMLECPPEELAQHLDEFAVHGESHFSQENTWMQETDFPSMKCHIDEHAAVMKSVHEVRQLLADGKDPAIARGLAAELAKWFPGHADYLDSALAQWLVKKSQGGVPVVLRRNMSFKS